MLFYGSFKMFPKTNGLAPCIVLLIGLGLLLIAHLLMLLKLSKNLFIVVLLFGLLISIDHICYSCDLNLNGGFLMTFGSKIFESIGINYVPLSTNSFLIFHIWKIKFFLIKLARCWNHPNGKNTYALRIQIMEVTDHRYPISYGK